MSIPCSEINQTINELIISFSGCNRINNDDLVKLVELVSAVRNCQDTSGNYNNLITEYYNPSEDFNLTYHSNTLHSISINVISGSVEENVNLNTVTYTEGSVINIEFTTLNSNPINYIIKENSIVVVKYITEDL